MNMISDTIKYIGVDDLDIDLFESQYVVPEGMSYNVEGKPESRTQWSPA